jgi:TRAP-type C4-dicarboxylate transport system permease small subunit
MQAVIAKINKVISIVFGFFARIFTIAFCLSVVIQVVARTMPFLRTPSWTEVVSRYCFIYAIAFAGALAAQTNSFVAVDILVGRIPPKFKRAYQIFLNAFLGAFCTFFSSQCAWRFANLKARMVSTALELPMQWIYPGVFICFTFLALVYFLEVLYLATGGELQKEVLQ